MSDLAVGQIVQLTDGRNGVVRFAGTTHFASGEWVGIELEDDSGKNDGSVQGERYFDCSMGRGMFVRPSTLTILAQAPAPAAAPAARPTVRKTSRPSSFVPGTGRVPSVTDPSMVKRMSLNAASPSPAPRTSRPASVVRSPTKSPTKQIGSTTSSTAPSRTGTPSNAKGTAATRTRPAVGVRTSMGPPPIPPARVTRQPSTSSATGRPPARPLSNRLSLSGSRNVPKPDPLRRPSADSQAGREPGSAADSGDDGRSSSPSKGPADLASPHATSPVQARTNALERLTSGRTATTTARSPATASPRTAGGNTAAARENEDLKAKLRRMQELRKQIKEAETRFEAVEQMQAEHETALELATLDREMAEETAEVLKAELEALKQKSEELELEVEILREENEEFSQGMTPEERSSTGWLQMERTNERLREALIRLRDLTQAQEAELRDQIKALESDLQDYSTVQEQFEASKEKLAQSESAVEDLRQQLDNALGAEDMIEDLTERNMSMAEEIEELKAVIEDLENLKEINDELEINHVQNEKEMQEELDFKDSVITEQARRAGQQEEALEDMEYTLSRFRELVTSLQGDLEDMRASHAVTEAESEQLDSKSRAMMDLNMKLQISAAKTQVKTIDLELRRLEAQEAEQHLEIVKLFLPETYQEDRDSVLALLRFKRLAFKATLLQGFVKEGRGVNSKEAKCASELQRSIALMTHLAEVHLTEDLQSFADAMHMRALVVQSHLDSAAAAITTARGMVQRVVPESGEDDEMAQHFSKKAEHVVGQTRSTKVIASKAVRALEDLKNRSLSLARDDSTEEAFEQCEEAAKDLAALARQIGLDLHKLLHEEGRTEPYTHVEVQNTMAQTALSAGSSTDSDLFSTYVTKLRVVTQQITDLAGLSSDLTQTQEFELNPAPWKLRSQELKALKTIPVDAEEELRRVKEEHNEARRTIAQRDESLSTATLKIETLESRMRDAHQKASRIADLEPRSRRPSSARGAQGRT
ncbi:dynactin [Verticillium alfalfae VaMs.102]|uniref:Dynactin n=1 Tax=Verticillium alfalfae (strain VaMs.102 / ATCC MYA-4576 / FGSC 10136) TaxID=526221 RepID=C9SKN1_VERA1|nr:dynactin [Verticillium alfalfae VaMs.102]EEY19249.1 dynactin [Verticillium alfalfae VaMs.102]